MKGTNYEADYIISPVSYTFYLLGPNIISTLFSNTFNLRYSLSVRDHVSYPHTTKGEITISYIVTFRWKEIVKNASEQHVCRPAANSSTPLNSCYKYDSPPHFIMERGSEQFHVDVGDKQKKSSRNSETITWV
jgi:hypothetical protein